MRAIVIEDDINIQQQIVERLKTEGFAVDATDNGDEGLYLAQEYPADVAIIDLGLPKMSGLEVIRRIRREGRRLPILILTARGRWQDKVEGLDAGADDYLVKPFHHEEMMARIGGRIDHVILDRVTPLAAPLFLEPGRIPIEGEGRERMIAQEAERLMAAAGLAL